jgi:adenine deaminase
MWARERARLLAVARGAAPADRYVRGGLLLSVYTLLFMTADFLPSVRPTADGVWDVKRRRILRRADAARGADARNAGG